MHIKNNRVQSKKCTYSVSCHLSAKYIFGVVQNKLLVQSERFCKAHFQCKVLILCKVHFYLIKHTFDSKYTLSTNGAYKTKERFIATCR